MRIVSVALDLRGVHYANAVMCVLAVQQYINMEKKSTIYIDISNRHFRGVLYDVAYH
jgi:hypothetical protein